MGDRAAEASTRGAEEKLEKIRINFRFLWLQRNWFFVLFATKKNTLKLMGKRSRIYRTVEITNE